MKKEQNWNPNTLQDLKKVKTSTKISGQVGGHERTLTQVLGARQIYTESFVIIAFWLRLHLGKWWENLEKKVLKSDPSDREIGLRAKKQPHISLCIVEAMSSTIILWIVSWWPPSLTNPPWTRSMEGNCKTNKKDMLTTCVTMAGIFFVFHRHNSYWSRAMETMR